MNQVGVYVNPLGADLLDARLRFWPSWWPKKTIKAHLKVGEDFRLTLPYDGDRPARCPEGPYLAGIPPPVPGHFAQPKIGPRLWCPTDRAGAMAVPETTVDENDLAAARQDYVGRPRQRPPMPGGPVA